MIVKNNFGVASPPVLGEGASFRQAGRQTDRRTGRQTDTAAPRKRAGEGITLDARNGIAITAPLIGIAR